MPKEALPSFCLKVQTIYSPLLLSFLGEPEDRSSPSGHKHPVPAGIHSSLIGVPGWSVLTVNLTRSPITSDTHPGVSDRVLTGQRSLSECGQHRPMSGRSGLNGKGRGGESKQGTSLHLSPLPVHVLSPTTADLRSFPLTVDCISSPNHRTLAPPCLSYHGGAKPLLP